MSPTDLHEYFYVLNIILTPILGGVVTWLWKLDARVFDLRAAIIGREEFRAQMQELRGEISDLRHSIETMVRK